MPRQSLPASMVSVSQDGGDVTENLNVPTAQTRQRRPAVSQNPPVQGMGAFCLNENQ